MSAFVGRERERELLAGGLRAPAARVVLVAGEPGVGKTRLAGEAATLARGLGRAYAAGRATDDEGSPPYRPVVQVLRALGRPDLLSETAPLADGRPEAAAAERFRRYEAVSEAFTTAAGDGGLLVLLDDLHWADAGTLRLLVHLARTLGDARVTVIGTYRDTEPGPALREALAALAGEPAVDRIRLTGLGPAEVAAQLDAMAGYPVPEAVSAAVHRRTGGNPFFVAELGRLLAAGGIADDRRLPDGVRDAVGARVGRLTPGARGVVRAGAVLGPALDPAALATATGVPLGDVLTALDEATAAGLVADGGFAHDLVREAAALEVPTAERLALHARMATHLRGRSDVDPRVVAAHLVESLPAGDRGAAVTWCRTAGDRAMAQLAWEEAAVWYGRALDAATGPELSTVERAAVLTDRARAQVRAYELAAARASLVAAADLARADGDGPALARAVLVMDGVSDFLWDPIGRGLAREALAALPEVDSGLRARVLAESVVMDAWRPTADADPRSRAALAMAERVGDRRALVEALRARQFACSGPDGAEERLALGDRLVALGLDGDDDALLWGHLWRFDACAQIGDLNAVAGEVTAIEALAERMRSPLARWHAIRSRATLDAAQGRFAEALAGGEASLAEARRSGNEGSILPSIGFLLAVRGAVGDFAQSPEAVRLVALDRAAAAGLKGMLAMWRLAAGQDEEARALFRELPSVDDLPPFVLLPAAAGMTELAATFGERDVVERLHAVLLPHAHRMVCGGAGVIIIDGPVRTPLGIGAAALNCLDEAEEHLRAAVDVAARAGLLPAVARARYHLARVLARRGRHAESAALATTVAAQAGELGLRPLREAATRLGRGAGPLTRREREVAALVARGLTSKAIAADLYLSERTVETHVQHILTKLGLANRTQIATWTSGLRTPDT